MVRLRAVSFFLILLLPSVLCAQNRYMVLFTDKDNSPYSVQQPEAFLSQRSLDRREKNNVEINEMDLPVNESYVQTLKGMGIETYFRTKWMNGVLVEMPANQINAVLSLNFVSSVLFVAPGAQLLDEEVEYNPGPPISAPIGSEVATDFQNNLIGIDKMHEQNIYGEGAWIAIFDAGFPNVSRIDAFSHLFSNDQIRMTHDYTFNQQNVETGHQHGLQVLSILAAEKADFQGISPRANYLLFITEDARANQEHRVEEFNWLFAAEAADSAGVDIISSSLGYSTFASSGMNYSYQDMDGETAIVSQAAGMAVDRGMLVVVSAGNRGNDFWRFITAPADHPEVLSIGSVNNTLSRVASSSLGPNSVGDLKPDVATFGAAAATITQGGGIALANGTSVAAPAITGLAAGLLQDKPDLEVDELIRAIKASGNQVSSPDNELGYGIPNFIRARESLEIPLIEDISDIIIFPNPSQDEPTYLTFAEDNFGIIQTVEVLSFDGKVLSINTVTPSEIKDSFGIDLRQNPAGIYLVRVSNDRRRITKRLIKY